MSNIRVEELRKGNSQHHEAIDDLHGEAISANEYFGDYSNTSGLIAFKEDNPVGIVGYSDNSIHHIFVRQDHRGGGEVSKALIGAALKHMFGQGHSEVKVEPLQYDSVRSKRFRILLSTLKFERKDFFYVMPRTRFEELKKSGFYA